jgi:hypothetical protein
MFNPIRSETVVLVATGIQHALSEYAATGSQSISKFDNTVTLSTQACTLANVVCYLLTTVQ